MRSILPELGILSQIAKFLALPRVADWLIRRAERTPYFHIRDAKDPEKIYMERYWLFNPYLQEAHRSWLPSIRIHHIRLPDEGRDLHNHPWDARTFILRGEYTEAYQTANWVEYRTHAEGETSKVPSTLFHRIVAVPPEGVYTLFITWRKTQTWGFLVQGEFVPYKDYLGL